jgi:Pretoxin HINT domain
MCFTSDTKVLMGDQTFKEIVDLKLGDMVQSFDFETGKMMPQKVTRLFTADQDHYYLINAKLKVTATHPFFTSEGKWKEGHQLKVGDKIQSDGVGKAIEITSIEKKDIDYQAYNFRVAEGHNYFISPDRIKLYLVHNAKYID